MDTASQPAVLVVEDEPLIRMDAVAMIEDAGFRAYEAGAADKAIAILEAHVDIGILFTDIELPGPMDGLGLALYVRDHRPSVFIIFASGAVGVDETAFPVGSLFFPKPYPAQTIIDALQKMAGNSARQS